MRTVNGLATKHAGRKAKIGTATESNKIAKAQAVIAENEKGNSQILDGPKKLENETSKFSAEIQSLKLN